MSTSSSVPLQKQRSVVSGLTGNELYCLDQLGFRPGNIVVGNSVYSIGFIGGLRSFGRGIVGGEMKQITEMISEGRHRSIQRLQADMERHQARGVTGVTSELIAHTGNVEFLSIGSSLHGNDDIAPFTSSTDGQDLFCQVDAGYIPVSFVFGNVAYSIGAGRGIIGAFRSLAKGEVVEYSEIFNATRHLALQRIEQEAQSAGANSVVGIRTKILPITGVQEMLMVGTASHTKYNGSDMILTSALTSDELWAVTKMGYLPLRLVMGTSVYSMGLVGGIKAALRNFVKGEISQMTELIYEARENSLGKVARDADAIGADDVLGVKTYVYDLGNGVIEFLAIGTAVKRLPDLVSTRLEQLPPQAIVRSKDTFVNAAERAYGIELDSDE